jgi:hypothetical protein
MENRRWLTVITRQALGIISRLIGVCAEGLKESELEAGRSIYWLVAYFGRGEVRVVCTVSRLGAEHLQISG